MPAIAVRGHGNEHRILALVRTLLDRPDLAMEVRDLDLDVPEPVAVSATWQRVANKAANFLNSLNITNLKVSITWAGLLIALLPSLERLKLNYRFDHGRFGEYNPERYKSQNASILGALFVNFTSNDLLRIPGLKSVTDITIRGHAGSLADWTLAALPKLQHLEMPGTDQFQTAPGSVVSHLSRVHLHCHTLAIQPNYYMAVTDFFDNFENLTRLKLTLTVSDSSLNFSEHYPFTTGNFAFLLQKLAPLQNKLEELDIQTNGNFERLIGPMPQELKHFSRLKTLRLPEKAIFPVYLDPWNDFPPHMEELELYNTTPRSGTWVLIVLENARKCLHFKRFILNFQLDFFPMIEAKYREHVSSCSSVGEPMYLRTHKGVDVMARIEPEL
jgi:hypothetical protein